MLHTLVYGAIIAGHAVMPGAINGNYASSAGMSYCASCPCPEPCNAPRARVSSILNRPTGYGYSVTYNYGLQPQPTGSFRSVTG